MCFQRRNESAAALHVVRYLHLMLSGSLEWISDAVFEKYRNSHYDAASLKVNEFYLKWKQEDCLQLLDEIPDVSDKAAMARMADDAAKKLKEKQQEEEAARYQRVTIVMEGHEEEEEEENEDDYEEVVGSGPVASTLTFSDSGYGSCIGGSSPQKQAGVSPSAKPSPAKCPVDDSVPPLMLPRFGMSPIRPSPRA